MKKVMVWGILGWLLIIGTIIKAEDKPKAPPEGPLSLITTLSDIMLSKEQLPDGWQLLDERVHRDHHDTSLLGTIEATAEAFDAKIKEQSCQSFEVNGKKFNVDLLLVPKGKGVLVGFLNGWLQPDNGDINWVQIDFENVIVVISTSEPTLQLQVANEYNKAYHGLAETKVEEAIKNGQEELALRYFKIIFTKLDDIGRGYMIHAGIYLHQYKAPQQALVRYEKSLQYRESSKFTDKELWMIYEGLAMAAAFSSDLEKCKDAFHKSYELAQKMKDNKLSASSAYNLACAYAELGEKAKAYQYLESAFKFDSTKAKNAFRDPSFKGLKDEKAFKELIQKYKEDN